MKLHTSWMIQVLWRIMHSTTLKRIKPLRIVMRWMAKCFVNILGLAKQLQFPSQWGWAPKLKFMFGLYEPGTTALCRRLVKPGMYVMDIGAHIGYYTLLFSKLVGPNGRVFAFEPHPEIFNMLRHNTRNRKNVIVFNKAVSNTNSEVEFFFSRKTSGSHSFYRTEFTEGSCKVQTVCLDDFIKFKGFEKIDLIKIDVEGAEPLVIEGMSKFIESTDTLFIILELNPSALRSGGHDPEKFLSLLLKMFDVHVINEENGSLSRVMDTNLAKRIPEWKAVNLLCTKGVKL